MSRRESKLGVKLAGGVEPPRAKPVELCPSGLLEGGGYTPWAGVSLLVELGRQCGVTETAERVLPPKKSAKGLKPWQMMESVIVLSALGGECVEDMGRLRGDRGLATTLGYQLPASETARQWLDGFHDEALMAEQPAQGCFLPKESSPLAALNEVRRRGEIWAYVEAIHPGWDVTLDVDAHLVETSKSGAAYCYEGYKAFQPMIVLWAETNLVIVDEFRQGNVPAAKDIKRVVNEAYGMLPPGPWQIGVRSDSAAYEQGNLDEWDHRGWKLR